MADELNRDAILVYLQNLKTIETIIKVSIEKRPLINEEISKLKGMYRTKYGNIPPKVYEFNPSFFESFLSMLPKPLICGVFVYICSVCFFSSVVEKMLELFSITNNKFIIYALIILIIVILITSIKAIKDRKEWAQYNERSRDEEKERLMKDYQAELKYNEEISNKIDNLSNTFIKLNMDIKKFTELRQKEYSLNIIPVQFRNITGIYYLYDYMSTSRQSLTDALLHADLNEIKQKLDQLINLQLSIIEQLDTLIEQNDRMMSSVLEIERNSALALEYSKISACNSELAVELQREQLGYQKAVYYLTYSEYS